MPRKRGARGYRGILRLPSASIASSIFLLALLHTLFVLTARPGSLNDTQILLGRGGKSIDIVAKEEHLPFIKVGSAHCVFTPSTDADLGILTPRYLLNMSWSPHPTLALIKTDLYLQNDVSVYFMPPKPDYDPLEGNLVDYLMLGFIEHPR
jgi:hypothetical protein